MSHKKKFKETKFGAWLFEKVPEAAYVIGNVLPDYGVWGLAKNLIDASTLSPEEKLEGEQFRLSEQKLWMEDMQKLDAEVTKRHSSDMLSDSWLSKNIRPLTLGYLLLFTSILIVLDSAIKAFVVKDAWVSLLLSLLATSFVFYFGGRTMEKIKSFIK